MGYIKKCFSFNSIHSSFDSFINIVTMNILMGIIVNFANSQLYCEYLGYKLSSRMSFTEIYVNGFKTRDSSCFKRKAWMVSLLIR